MSSNNKPCSLWGS